MPPETGAAMLDCCSNEEALRGPIKSSFRNWVSLYKVGYFAAASCSAISKVGLKASVPLPADLPVVTIKIFNLADIETI